MVAGFTQHAFRHGDCGGDSYAVLGVPLPALALLGFAVLGVLALLQWRARLLNLEAARTLVNKRNCPLQRNTNGPLTLWFSPLCVAGATVAACLPSHRAGHLA